MGNLFQSNYSHRRGTGSKADVLIFLHASPGRRRAQGCGRHGAMLCQTPSNCLLARLWKNNCHYKFSLLLCIKYSGEPAFFYKGQQPLWLCPLLAGPQPRPCPPAPTSGDSGTPGSKGDRLQALQGTVKTGKSRCRAAAPAEDPFRSQRGLARRAGACSPNWDESAGPHAWDMKCTLFPVRKTWN